MLEWQVVKFPLSTHEGTPSPHPDFCTMLLLVNGCSSSPPTSQVSFSTPQYSSVTVAPNTLAQYQFGQIPEEKNKKLLFYPTEQSSIV